MSDERPATTHHAVDRGVCASCQEPILWRLHLSTGRLAPINAAPDPNGNVELLSDGRHYQVSNPTVAASLRRHQGVELHLSHFATCTRAHAWRARTPAHKEGGTA